MITQVSTPSAIAHTDAPQLCEEASSGRLSAPSHESGSVLDPLSLVLDTGRAISLPELSALDIKNLALSFLFTKPPFFRGIRGVYLSLPEEFRDQACVSNGEQHGAKADIPKPPESELYKSVSAVLGLFHDIGPNYGCCNSQGCPIDSGSASLANLKKLLSLSVRVLFEQYASPRVIVSLNWLKIELTERKTDFTDGILKDLDRIGVILEVPQARLSYKRRDKQVILGEVADFGLEGVLNPSCDTTFKPKFLTLDGNVYLAEGPLLLAYNEIQSKCQAAITELLKWCQSHSAEILNGPLHPKDVRPPQPGEVDIGEPLAELQWRRMLASQARNELLKSLWRKVAAHLC